MIPEVTIAVLTAVAGWGWRLPPRRRRARARWRLDLPGRVGRGVQGRRGERRRRTRLPLTLEVIARELRAGVTLDSALRRAARVDETGLAEAVARVEQGEKTIDAVDRWLAEVSPDDAALVGGVFHLGLRTGVATADALERAAISVRARHEILDEIDALTAQSRTSAVLVAAAPFGFLLLVGSVDGASVAFLVMDPRGWFCLLGGVTLDVVGFWWMRRLVVRLDP